MQLKFGQALIDSLRGKNQISKARSKVYRKIYYPLYDLNTEIDPQEPLIYNSEGSRLRSYFLRDIHWAHSPTHMQSKYFIWDRYNFGLKTHFYSHNSMLETMGAPSRRYGLLWESEAIVPRDYKIFDLNRGLENDFDLIFTFSEKLLEKLENARFFPGCASVWYGTIKGGGIISDEAFVHKTKLVSILSSKKSETPLHKYRLQLARVLKYSSKVDTFGTFDGGDQVLVGDTLTKYRFSFAIENDIQPLFFTEKITNCFASMTVPIYLGSPRIGKFFNEDGIIELKYSDIDDIDNILSRCTKSEYERRLPAILDNYNRVKSYVNTNDWLYEAYLQDC